MPILGSEPTGYFLARCAPCVRPVRGDSAALHCPECGQRLKGDRLFAVTRDASCDGRCMSAVRSSCSCSCGGANHGAGWSVGGPPTWTTEETEAALNIYRARVAQEETKRRQLAKAKTDAARREFEQWSAGREDIVTYLTGADPEEANEFVLDMARQARQLKPLTERQESGVRKCMEYDRRRAEAAEQRAREAAEAQPVPTGKAITVEGEIVHTTVQDNPFGPGGTYKMLVKGADGWKVWTTIPSGIRDLYRGRAGDAFGLRGRHVRFTADIAASEDDQCFGRAKRPRAPEMLSPAVLI